MGGGAPWPDGQGGQFHLPFVYSSNGRSFVKQLAKASLLPLDLVILDELG